MRSRKRSPKRSITCSMRRMSIRSLPSPRIIADGSSAWTCRDQTRRFVSDASERQTSAARSFNRVDYRIGTQCGYDRRQVLHVADLDVDHDLKEVRRAVGDF